MLQENHSEHSRTPTSTQTQLECTSNEAPGVSNFKFKPFEDQRGELRPKSYGTIQQDYIDQETGHKFSMYTTAGYICRCPDAHKRGDWDNVKTREQGKGALDVRSV